MHTTLPSVCLPSTIWITGKTNSLFVIFTKSQNMKNLLLLCSALSLAGCNSSPSNSDLENFLEPKFASCQNIKLVDIKKTNGYEEDNHYRVDFSYGIELKDASRLKEIKAIWLQEHERSIQAQTAYAERDQRVAAMRQEIQALEKESAPRYEQFDDRKLNYFQSLSTADGRARQDQYLAALNAWRLNPPEELRKKQEELKTYEQAFREQWGHYKYQILGKVDSTISRFYRQGCHIASSKFTEGMLLAHSKAAEQTDDISQWFEIRPIQMKGSVTMRKTENGWRALSDR